MTIVLKVNNGSENFPFSIFISEIPFEANTPYYYFAALGNLGDEVDEFMSIDLKGLFIVIKEYFTTRKWKIIELSKTIVGDSPIEGIDEHVLKLIKENRADKNQLIIPLLKNEINEEIAIMITSKNYNQNYYQGKLVEITNEFITLELEKNYSMKFNFDDFILATPLNRYM